MNERHQFHRTLRFVLAGLDFPAQRWEIITKADTYGADSMTTQRLRRLPPREEPYRDLDEVLDMLARTTQPGVMPGRR